jgi:hypothetical protein
MREELQQCKQWAADRNIGLLERAYAAAVLGADGGCADTYSSSSAGVNQLALQAFRTSRQNHLESRKQFHLQQELQKMTAAAGSARSNRGAAGQPASSSSSCTSAAAAAAALVCLSEQPIPVLHLRVRGVVPQGCGASWGYGEAVVKVWRPCEAVQQLDEGAVVLATGLSAGTDGRSSTVEGRGKMLELSTGKMTRCVQGPVSGAVVPVAPSVPHLVGATCGLLVLGDP